MNNKDTSKSITRGKALRRIYGDLNDLDMSEHSRDVIGNIIQEHDGFQAFPSDQRDAIVRALAKEANTLERHGIPVQRAFSDISIQPDPGTSSSYRPSEDVMTLGFHKNKDPHLQALVRFMHENKHRALSMPYGRHIADRLRQQHQNDAVKVPFQSEWDLKPNSDWNRGSSIVYRTLRDNLESVYSQGDYGVGFPVEFLPTVASNIIEPQTNPFCRKGYLPKYGVEQLHDMLTSIGKVTGLEEPDITKEALPRKHYSHRDYVAVTDHLIKTMKKIAVTKEALRTVLASYQNKTMGILRLAKHPNKQHAQNDLARILQNDTALGLSNPSFYHHNNIDDYYDALQHPVPREPDGFMHKFIEDDTFKKLNHTNFTPPLY